MATPKPSLGQVGYEAYADAQQWKNYQGLPIPAWEQVRSDIKAAWEVGAEAVIDAWENRHTAAQEDS
jgi:hypothetical protein